MQITGEKEAEMNKDGKPHSPTIRTTLLASGLSFQARSEDWDKFVWASFLFQVHVNVWTEFCQRARCWVHSLRVPVLQKPLLVGTWESKVTIRALVCRWRVTPSC